MMYFLHTLKQLLASHVIRLESRQDFLSIPGVLLLESADQYDPEFLCIANPEISAVILKAQKSGYLITAGSSEELLRLSCPEQMLLIVTDLSAIALNNLLNSMLFEKNRIQEVLSSASPYQLSHLIRLAHQISNASFAILDSNAAFLYDSIRLEDNHFFAPLIQKKKPLSELFQSLSGTSASPDAPLLHSDKEQLIILLPFLRNSDKYLLCSADPDNASVCLTSMIFRELCEPLLSSITRLQPDHSLSFPLFFSRLMSENGDSDDALMIMLHSLANPPRKNMRLLLIRSELCPEGSTRFSLDYLVKPISRCFPKANVALSATELVVLLSSDTAYCPLPITPETFEQVLEEQKAIAILSNPFTSIMTMRVSCRMCQRIFPIAMTIKQPEEKRCMSFGRYTQYNVIDICARSIASLYGGSDIVILTHPGVVNLTRYDRANGTNLRDIMFYYLMNDRNIARTSAEMFLHRNTLIYKIKKIEELIGESMDDPYLRHALIFSCLLLRYRELFQKEGVSFSKLSAVKPHQTR